MTTLVIAGGRNFNNYILLKNTFDKLVAEYGEVEFVCATEFGANTLAEAYAVTKGYTVKAFGDSGNYGEEMIKYAADREGILVAFWDGKSPGTKGMIDLGKRYGVETKVIMY